MSPRFRTKHKDIVVLKVSRVRSHIDDSDDDADKQIPNLSLAFYARQSLIKTCLSDEQYSNTYMFNEFKQIQREFNALE